MGMDKKLQCLVGLTWWNLLQCTWGEAEWPASCKPAATYFRTISSGRNISGNLIESSTANLRKVFREIFSRCGKSWWSVEVWWVPFDFDTVQQQKKTALHCISHLHTTNCTHVHMYSVHYTCTLHTASNTLAVQYALWHCAAAKQENCTASHTSLAPCSQWKSQPAHSTLYTTHCI